MAQDCVYQSNFLSMPGQEKPAALMQIQNIPTVAASQLQYSTTSSSRCGVYVYIKLHINLDFYHLPPLSLGELL